MSYLLDSLPVYNPTNFTSFRTGSNKLISGPLTYAFVEKLSNRNIQGKIPEQYPTNANVLDINIQS